MRCTTTPSRPLHALLAGGGTGGHVFPALAVAEELVRRGWSVSFAGMADGLEARLVPQQRLPFHALPARPMVGRGLVGKAGALGTLGRGALAARALLRQARRRRGARHRRLRVSAGRARRPPGPPAGRAARAQRAGRGGEPLALALGGRRRGRLPRDDGGPQVPGLGDRRAGARGLLRRAAEPPAGPPRLLVLGGSQGARQINQAMLEAAATAHRAPPRALASSTRPAPGTSTRRAKPTCAPGRCPGRRGGPVPRRRRRRHGGEPPRAVAGRRHHPRRDLRRRPAGALRAAGHRPGAPGGQRAARSPARPGRRAAACRASSGRGSPT